MPQATRGARTRRSAAAPGAPAGCGAVPVCRRRAAARRSAGSAARSSGGPGWAARRAAPRRRCTVATIAYSGHYTILWWSPSHVPMSLTVATGPRRRGRHSAKKCAPSAARRRPPALRLGWLSGRPARLGGATSGNSGAPTARPRQHCIETTMQYSDHCGILRWWPSHGAMFLTLATGPRVPSTPSPCACVCPVRRAGLRWGISTWRRRSGRPQWP